MKKILILLLVLAAGALVFFLLVQGGKEEGISLRIVSDEINGPTNMEITATESGDKIKIQIGLQTFYYFAPDTFVYVHENFARPYIFQSHIDEEKLADFSEGQIAMGMHLVEGISDYQTNFLPMKRLTGSFFWSQLALQTYQKGELENGENEFYDQLLERWVRAEVADFKAEGVKIKMPQDATAFRDLVAYDALINEEPISFEATEVQKGDDSKLTDLYNLYKEESAVRKEELDAVQLPE
ncbi:MAG: hypothetical protein Q8P45_00330 [Candidatus Harrisonbacteria bacterium]|nr:hypothetical protein [Candidatus Harrisonbacteria bacterium]